MVRAWQAKLGRILSGVLSEWSGETRSGGLPRWLGFWVHVFREFWRNRCQVRASALAYTTLLALVPLLAVVVSVASLVVDVNKPEQQQKLRAGVERLVNSVAPSLGLSDAAGNKGRDEVVTNLLQFVGKIRFGAIGVSAMAGLFFVAISLLRTIEAAFNDIWGVSAGRGWFQSIVLYWAAITLGPLVFLVIKSADVFKYLEKFGAAGKWFQEGSPGYLLLLLSKGLPTVLLTLGLVALYRLMPNTRVRWPAALVGAVVAAALWWLNDRAAFFYQTRVVTYSAVYGSLGLLPLFLIGLYLSWLILLLGSQTAYVFQHREAYLQELQAERIDQTGREWLAIRVMLEIGRQFSGGRPGPDLETLANSLRMPNRLAGRIVAALMDAGLVNETSLRASGKHRPASEEEPRYAPARPLEALTLTQIWRAMRGSLATWETPVEDPPARLAREELARLISAAEERGGQVTVAALVHRLETPT